MFEAEDGTQETLQISQECENPAVKEEDDDNKKSANDTSKSILSSAKDVLHIKSLSMKDKIYHLQKYILSSKYCDNEVKNTLLFLVS